ncbi:MAG TPA: FlgD immunoglobulin-like domain containing protein [Gaiellaceae bacterium]|nr:FlgD immunoglobulin-like domain containing protein [Gaiellaceae bacterium]
MARILPTVVVLALLGCTAAAFAVTEGLKLERSPISRTNVDKVIAPDSASHAAASIQFVLRKGDRVTVAIVNGNGEVVRTIVRSRLERPGAVQFTWNGRGDGGEVVPDGFYRPRVHLAHERRTILLPNPIRMDATPPLIRLASVRPRVIAPFGKNSLTRIRYQTSERAQALLYVDGAPKTHVRRFLRAGKFEWGGRAARGLGPGAHRLRLRSIDLATNVGPPSRALTIVLRFVELRPHLVRVAAGRRFGFRVLNAQRYAVHFRSLHEEHAGPLLILRAPRQPGRYVLRVATDGHVARAIVVVTK